MLDLPLTFLKRPAATVARPWLLVLLHGVGSNEQDLFALCAHLPERYWVLSLRAPHRMGPGAFAWFDYSIEPGGARTIDEAQERASRALLSQTLAQASEQLGIAPERVVVAGFSQGGAMALGLLLTQPALMRAAIVWHGRLMDQHVAELAPADAFRGRALWVSHGTHDGVIPIAHAQAVARHVAPLPLAFTYREFPSEHEIRPSELAATLAWLEALSTAPNAF